MEKIEKTLLSVEGQDNKKRIGWNPNYDEYLKLAIKVNPEDEQLITEALESSYSPERRSSKGIDQLGRELTLLKSLLDGDFEDDVVYELIKNEKDKLENKKDRISKREVAGGFVGEDEKSEFSDNKIGELTGHLYKTTRGFMKFRASVLEDSINEMRRLSEDASKDNEKLSEARDKIKKL